MRITYSTAADRAKAAAETRKASRRFVELLALACTSLISLAGLVLVYNAKTAAASDIEQQLGERRVVDLSRVQTAADLLPGLTAIADPTERRIVSERLYAFVTATDGGGTRRMPESVAALGRATVTAGDIARDRRLAFLKERLKPAPVSSGRLRPMPNEPSRC